jgi:8-oxo-dGTP pyrophosphatase MutT (NUDIX family)
LSEPVRLLEVGELDFAFEPSRWPFAERRAAGIAAHWARLTKAKPALFNGRVLLLGRRKIEAGRNGTLALRGAFFETDYADFLAWEEFGEPGEAIDNCFSMAALRSVDGAFVLGEMAHHTFNAGQIYFPAGTPDPSDIFEGKVDLEASARRELLEETGVSADEASVAPGWTLVFTPRRIACMKPMTLAATAAEVKARIEAYLARDPHAEFSRIHIIRGPRDIDASRVPAFVAAYLRNAFDRRAAV